MADSEGWDWSKGRKVLADLAQLSSKYSRIDEYAASPDGEKLAVVAKAGEGDFLVCLNNEPLEGRFELCWHLRYSPLGRLAALVRQEDEWTVAIDGQPFAERFEYAWSPKFSSDGGTVAFAYKRDNLYGVSVEGKVWDKGFHGIRDFCLSGDGSRAAATVQVEPLAEADVPGFFKGAWSLAVDGAPWEGRFVNVWSPAMSPDARSVAAEVRTENTEYSIAVDGRPWASTFGAVWAPSFHPRGGSVVAPVRHEGGWRLFRDGAPLWEGCYLQLWQQRFSPDGSRIAAVASPEFGMWTIVVDDKPWRKLFSEMALPPVFSPDGSRVAALVKDDGRWTVAVDGVPAEGGFDQVWDPVFSPCGSHVLAKAELAGKYVILADGARRGKGYDMLWDPAFSPDGQSVLLRYVEGDKYCRQVTPAAELLGK